MLFADDESRVLLAPPRLDADSRLEFRHAALEYLEQMAASHEARISINLRQTAEIDVSGLAVLVLVQKRGRERGLATRLVYASAAVKEMLDLTRLNHLFELES